MLHFQAISSIYTKGSGRYVIALMSFIKAMPKVPLTLGHSIIASSSDQFFKFPQAKLHCTASLYSYVFFCVHYVMLFELRVVSLPDDEQVFLCLIIATLRSIVYSLILQYPDVMAYDCGIPVGFHF